MFLQLVMCKVVSYCLSIKHEYMGTCAGISGYVEKSTVIACKESTSIKFMFEYLRCVNTDACEMSVYVTVH